MDALPALVAGLRVAGVDGVAPADLAGGRLADGSADAVGDAEAAGAALDADADADVAADGMAEAVAALPGVAASARSRGLADDPHAAVTTAMAATASDMDNVRR